MSPPIHVPWQGKPSEEELAPFLAAASAQMQRRLIRNAYEIVGDWHAAEDVLQETLLAFCLSLRAGKLEGDVAPWLWTVTRNTAVSHARDAVTRAALFQGDSRHLADAVAPAGQENELGALAKACLSELPGKQKRAVELVCLEGLTWEQAAQRLGCAVTTARKNCSLGLGKLKILVEKRKSKGAL